MLKLVSCVVVFFLLALHWTADSCGESISNINEAVRADNAIAQADLESEEYAVYSALIEGMYVSKDTRMVVIRSRTIAFPEDDQRIGKGLLQHISKSMPELSKEAFNNYLVRNKESHPLSKRFKLRVRYEFVGKEERGKVLEKDISKMWDDFYKEYPGSSGLISLSSVGFNPEMTQAFLYVSHSCGILCASGHCVLLAKENGIWKILKKDMLWIS